MNTQLSPSVSVPAQQSRAAQLHQLYRRYGILAVLVLLCIVLSFANQYFLTWGNIADVLRQTSINGILAVGMTYVVLTGGIDLSVGSTLALAGMVSASVVTGAHPHGVALGLLAGLVVGAAVGAVNGIVVARLAVPSFVATLGMLSVARGLTFIYNDGMPIADLPDGYLSAGTGTFAGVPVPVIVFALVVLLFWFVLRYTTYGRYVYAVGGNAKSAKTSGISTGKIIFSVYVIGGLLAGLAGRSLVRARCDRRGRDRRYESFGRLGFAGRHRGRRAADRRDQQRPESARRVVLLPAGRKRRDYRRRRSARCIAQEAVT
jgi:putative xylitol transport system permease protein